MQWLKAKLETPCLACGISILKGERIFPAEDVDGSSRYMHLSCARETLPAGPDSTEPEAPICKHWRARGFCLYGERCVFRHPPESLHSFHQQQAQLAAQQAALASSNSVRGLATRRPGQRRVQPRNRFRASSFRRFLIDTFGREKLREGTGVLDVAGGKGELAFELINLNATPATVVEPRLLELQKRVKWLLSGFYSWNAAFSKYNDRQWVSSPVEAGCKQGQQGQQQAGEEQQGQQGQQQGGGDPRAPVYPDHLRLVVTPALAACLTAGSRSSSSCSCSSSTSSSPSRSSCGGGSGDSVCGPASSSGSPRDLSAQRGQQVEELAGPAEAEAFDADGMPTDWFAVFEQAQWQARRNKWLKPGAAHEDGPPAAAAAVVPARTTAAAAAAGDVEPDWGGVQPADGPSAAEVAAAAAAAPVCRAAVAWSIPAGSDSDDEYWWCRNSSKAATALAPDASAVHGTSSGEQSYRQQDTTQQGKEQQHLQQPTEVCDAAAAWRCFTQCSVVAGLHPDQATEFVVDLAIAHGKPFAVVPCCVYSCEFPRRLLGGQLVTSYDQFVDYLAAKDPERIRVATLPFEGRNKVLYRVM